jgi:hypothetical protein
MSPNYQLFVGPKLSLREGRNFEHHIFEMLYISFKPEFNAEFSGIICFLASSKLSDLFAIQQYSINYSKL